LTCYLAYDRQGLDPGDPTALLCSLVLEPDAVFPREFKKFLDFKNRKKLFIVQ
jgi:hypothetical protein